MTAQKHPKRKHLTVIEKGDRTYFRIQINKVKLGLKVNKTFTDYDQAVEFLNACENKLGAKHVKTMLASEEQQKKIIADYFQNPPLNYYFKEYVQTYIEPKYSHLAVVRHRCIPSMTMDAFWRKVDQSNHKQKAHVLQQELRHAVKTGGINSRPELVAYMDETLGMKITRTTDTTVSVKFPGSQKAMRLKGPMFETQTDFSALRSAAKQKTGTEKLSVPDYMEAQVRLNQLLKVRAAELQGHRTQTPHNRKIRKERVYGRERQYETRLGRAHASRQNFGRDHGLPISTGVLERGMFQAGSRQWRHENGRGHPTGHAGPQDAESPVQHANYASQHVASRQSRRRGSGWSTTGGDIDQKIWALVIDLNGCEAGTLEANAILNQLAVLQGEKDRLPKGPKRKR